ncbi:MAG: hypothetical protein MK171_01090 [Pirellulales bacterium]|nr:hypothetical protein [Pirellulales bacterium]
MRKECGSRPSEAMHLAMIEHITHRDQIDIILAVLQEGRQAKYEQLQIRTGEKFFGDRAASQNGQGYEQLIACRAFYGCVASPYTASACGNFCRAVSAIP